ncbi:hypothetical protein BBJ28_00026678, partial [Nothophytophthora sp. Chile5]
MVRFGALSNLQKRVNRVLVVGSLETLQQQGAAGSFLQQTLASAGSTASESVTFTGANPVLLQHALAHLNPTTDSGATAQLLLMREASADALHVTLHALPTMVSRSNSFARPHSISAFVKSNCALFSKTGSAEESDEAVLVVLMLPGHVDTWFAAGAAVARAAPPYVHKQKKINALPITEESTTAADQLEVVYETPLTAEQTALVQHTANAIQLATRLVDAPPNELHSDAFIAEARAVADRTNSKATVIQGEELREKGFGGIYGVGKAAAHAPALVVLTHVPTGADASAKGVAMVGKGIIYDTGGLSIKTGGFMVGMKRDMGGAASLLAAFEAACLSKNTTDKTPLHVVLCIAENSVGPLATRPDDIHTLYSGKTVEINNTDAEGRLVLADG